MSLSKNAETIYKYLSKNVLPTKRVITYGELSDATRIPLGEAGAPVRMALYEIFNACDNQLGPAIPLRFIACRLCGALDLLWIWVKPALNSLEMKNR